MKEQNIKYLRIAELSENIEKLNKIIELHQNTTNDASMIKQYAYKREEHIVELQELFRTLSITIVPNEWNQEIQLSKVKYQIQTIVMDKDKLPNRAKLKEHMTELERIFNLLGNEIAEISHL